MVGLGAESTSKTVNLEIRWPNGAVQKFTNLRLRQYHKIVESTYNLFHTGEQIFKILLDSLLGSNSKTF
jgi:hypothetical protein